MGKYVLLLIIEDFYDYETCLYCLYCEFEYNLSIL